MTLELLCYSSKVTDITNSFGDFGFFWNSAVFFICSEVTEIGYNCWYLTKIDDLSNFCNKWWFLFQNYVVNICDLWTVVLQFTSHRYSLSFLRTHQNFQKKPFPNSWKYLWLGNCCVTVQKSQILPIFLVILALFWNNKA